MTTVPQGGLVLVTGVTGYIASWTALKLLERGYRVRGTARTASKAEYLRDGPFKAYADKFEVVSVADIELNNAFDDAVKGVDGIAHIASPFHYNVTDPYKDLINPAVNGTLNLLKAAKNYGGPQLKRVVITSSFASIMEPKPEGFTYDEAIWNESSVALCEAYKSGASTVKPPPNQAYRASKALAERALWEFEKTEKPQFQVAAINPVFVFGPIIHAVKDAEGINTSVNLLYKYFAGLHSTIEEGDAPKAYVDVRDVAEAHVRALEVEEAKGKRFLNAGGPFSWEGIVDVLRQNYKDKKFPPPTGEKVGVYQFDNTQSRTVLGLKYFSLEETVLATTKSVEQFLPK